MIVRKVWVLRGPNIWAHHPMLEAWVDLEDLRDSDPAAIPGFIERMTGWLSVLGAGEGSSPDREALVERLRSGASLAEVFVSLAGVLQATRRPRGRAGAGASDPGGGGLPDGRRLCV